MKKAFLFLSLALLMDMPSKAQAAGFEKAILWSGKEAGYGVASISRIGGSQSIAVNPAGLVNGADASLNFSPTWVSLEGNLVSTNRLEESDHNFSPVGEISVNYLVFDRLGVGVGAYVAGGSNAIYDGVDFTGTYSGLSGFKPRIFTQF